MKTKLLRLCLTALMMLVTTASYAETACIDGIYYNIYGNWAEVTYKDNSYNSYSGDITIPSTLTHNGEQINVTSIGKDAFRECNLLKSVIVPYSVTKIGWTAFYGCPLLASVTLTDNIEEIESHAFSECKSLRSIVVPKKLKKINCFSGSGLVSIVLPEGIETIEAVAFYNCKSLKEISLPTTLTTIGLGAFQDCSVLEKIFIPECVKSIPQNCFTGCTNLSKVSLPSGLEIISKWAFSDCSNIEDICIPASVEFIGEYAFQWCDKIRNIVVMSPAPPMMFVNTFESWGSPKDKIYNNATLWVPNSDNALEKYKFSETWGQFKTIVETDVASVAAIYKNNSSQTTYTIDGRRINEMKNGVNIIRTEDGKTIKVLKK